MDLNLLVSLAIILLLLVIAAAVLTPRRPTEHLAHRFGPEHERSGLLGRRQASGGRAAPREGGGRRR